MMNNREYAVINGTEVDVTTVFDKTVGYIPTMEESEKAVQKGEELLNQYFDCLKDNEGLWNMFRKDGAFWKAKGWIIQAMRKHPNYNGNYQIVLKDQNMCRHIDKNITYDFFSYMNRWISKNKKIVIDSTGEVLSREEQAKRKSEILNKYYTAEEKYNMYKYPAYLKLKKKLYKEYDDITSYSTEKTFTFVSNAIRSIDDYISDTGNHLVDERLEKSIKAFAEMYLPDFHACQSGQKISKLVQKLGKIIGINNHVDIQDVSFYRQDGEYVSRTKDMGWNYQYAQFADAINPIILKGTAVISVNPIDFWTMSFGKGWASCHTIDKENRRRCDHNYSGCYCGGTESYMLDNCSVIFYFLPNNFDGENPEYEDKVKRCVFYLGEDKIIQSRVYPDGRDGGDMSLAGDIRTIMQKVVSELWDVPNYWNNSKGTSACSEVTTSVGPHYRDYLHYEDCNVSYMKRIDGYKNVKRIRIGSDIICPSCGVTHNREDNIFCVRCTGDLVCEECGEFIDDGDVRWIDGNPYCWRCTTECDRCGEYELDRYMTDTNNGCRCRSCISNYYTWSSYEDTYIDDEDVVVTEEGRVCDVNGDGYLACESCGKIHDDDEMNYDEETDGYYCGICYNELIASRETEANEE